MESQREIEILNNHLIQQRDELKDEIKELKLNIEKKNQSIMEYFDKLCIIKMPFGLPNDTKLIEVLVTKEAYQKEILPYNKMLNALHEAKEIQPPTETKKEEVETIQK